MVIVFLVLLVVVCLGLGFFVLIQNPKGGGLAGSIGGFNNNIMGVKQTTDVLEKGTWIFASLLAVLAITSIIFLKGSVSKSADGSIIQKVNTNSAPSNKK